MTIRHGVAVNFKFIHTIKSANSYCSLENLVQICRDDCLARA
ncbi:hypothetical protein CAMRE0001_1241 [Campylobacter rectus RM3267]|uniref:Uncharacterized protein n=1 Tax=Campylobacter rectus RM3267 TaxID=553218 RepID=B9D0N3_CAMRE|nr:hypothetical protein CAMRE0001_1241 [Campylobacter rectus RM3267]